MRPCPGTTPPPTPRSVMPQAAIRPRRVIRRLVAGARPPGLILLTLFGTPVAVAAPGEPDRSFGTNGTVLLDLGGSEGADALMPLPGGGLVVAGYGDRTNVSAAFTATGARDASYGDRGVIVTSNPGVSGAGVSPVPSFREGDGKLVSAGAATIGSGTREDPTTGGTRLALYRTDANGRPDPGFGSGGTATLPGDATRRSRAVLALPQAGGRILAIGTTATSGRSDTSELLFARFNADGSLDDSFGNGGSRTAPAAGLGSARIDVAGLAGGGVACAFCHPPAGGGAPPGVRVGARTEEETS